MTARERPILFSGEMVRAILTGRKTQTRRVVKQQPEVGRSGCWFPERNSVRALHYANEDHLRRGLPLDFSPYGVPGDRLWVRETWAHDGSQAPPLYRADWLCQRDFPGVRCEHGPARWSPSIFMPRWASRITLEVTGVRVERLQRISEEDAQAEGVSADDIGRVGLPCYSARQNFERIWERINGAESWKSNPWVWVINFRKAET